MHKMLRLMIFVVLVLVFGSVEGSRWSETGECCYQRSGADGAVLPDGRVMVMGSNLGSGGNKYEIFDPAKGTWTEGGLSGGSASHTMATLLYNGKVLYVGGDINLYLYDPINNSWASTGLFFTMYSSQSCGTLLRDGNVLAFYIGQNCDLYDYVGNTLTNVNASSSHWAGIEVLLPSGEVLLAGGNSSRTCEIYDPGAGSWGSTGSMNSSRSQHVGVLLRPPIGKVLVAGGTNGGEKTELYDPNSRSWAYTAGDLNYYERSTGAMALLPSGKALMIGGINTAYSCEIYNPSTEMWSIADSVQYERNHCSAAILLTGKAMVMGSHVSTVATRCEIYDPTEPVWAPKVTLNEARAAHTVTPLPIIATTNCSTNVLITGGENSADALKSCELYNYSRERVAPTGELNIARSHHTAVLLSSGRVLAAGGKNSAGLLRSCELYNVSTESWELADSLDEPRFDHTATPLKNGNVLVTGGESVSGAYLGSCLVYSGGAWTATNPMSDERVHHTAVLLLDGSVLVIGGETSGGTTDACEIWDGTNWSNVPSLNTARSFHTATLLQSGRVLVVGGMDSGGGALASCEIYDPVVGSWTLESNLSEARYLHNTTLLYSGLVLATGGHNGTGYLSSCEIWDPGVCDPVTDKHEWKEVAPLVTGRGYHSSVLIPDIQPYILVVGGNDGAYIDAIEEYDVGLGYLNSWQSTITNYPSVTHVSGSMNIEGRLFRGVSEADGGNHCHAMSNDHPIISLVRIGGGNWQGNGGGEIMYVPSSHEWDETHTNVDLSDTASGFFRLWSIVNGIPCRWYDECLGVENSPQSTVHSPQLTIFPNPSTSDAGVSFGFKLSTMDGRPLTLSIYDLSGRVVRSFNLCNLGKSVKSPPAPDNGGRAGVSWDGRDDGGQLVPSGVYFVKLREGDRCWQAKKLLFLR